MKILLIGPLPHGGGTTGVQEFNRFLARILLELGHRVEVALPGRQSIFSADTERSLTLETGCRVFFLPEAIASSAQLPVFFGRANSDSLAQTLSRFDAVILSGSNLAYANLLCAACGLPCFVWTHGQQISPFGAWDGKELTLPGAKLVCINELHYLEAEARGFDDHAVRVDMPIPYRTREVQPAGGFAAAVCNLELRKNIGRIAEIAKALGCETHLYGSVVHDQAKESADTCGQIKRMGTLPHDELLSAVATADFGLFASMTEGRSMAALELMGLGVPLIVPDIPIWREFVSPEYNIFLDPAQPVSEQLATMNLDAFRMLEHRQALAANTHKHFGVEQFIRQLESLLNGG